MRIRRATFDPVHHFFCNLLPGVLVLSFITCAMSAQQAGSPASPPANQVTVAVDLSKTSGPYKPIYSWFGYDEGNYTTAPGGRKLLGELRDLSPVPVYIRFHHLLTSGDGTPELKWSSTGVYSEDAQGRPVYNFHILDGMFDALKDAGVRPMVEFGFMPKDLAATLPDRHEPYQVHYPGSTISGASNNPPKDYEKWGALIRAVTEHLVERYGRDAVLQWYFEVWNEPDIDYWHTSFEDYCKLYDYTVASVRAVLPQARVGGPATTGPTSKRAEEFLARFLEHVSSGTSAANGEAVPIDFISFHAKGHPTLAEGSVQMGISHELTDAREGFATIAKFPKLRHLPIILSEADPEGCAACSSKVNPANDYRNDTLYPAYTAAAFKALFELSDKADVNLLSMLSWSFEFEGKDYFEGFRSLSTNGIDKPVLNFFRMAGLMSGDRVGVSSTGASTLDELLKTGVTDGSDVDALATRATGETAVLLWNYSGNPRSGSPAAITLKIAHLPPEAKRVLVEHYRIDSSHSNAHTLWKAMGSPQHPTPDQYDALKSRAGLELLASPRWAEPASGTLTIETDLPSEALSLIRLSW
jgi:xylan 1,4-beta-xylosidase